MRIGGNRFASAGGEKVSLRNIILPKDIHIRRDKRR